MAEWSSCPCPELDGWKLSLPALMLLLQVTRQGELRPLDKPGSSQRTWWDTGVWIVWDILVSGGGVPGDHRPGRAE